MRALLRVTTLLVVAGASGAAAQTSITSASPSRLSVTAGGDAVSIAIEGTSLEAISGARVTLNGQAVSTVEALPVKPRFPTSALTRMSITVTASATAAGGTYQLEALAGRLVIRVPVSITVGTSRTITPTRTLSLPPPPVPSVTSASPSTLQLQAGGASQTVNLQGSNLDRVTGARVERNGSPANGMSVQLQASTGSTQRSVTLSAATNAGPPWAVPLDLVLLASPQGTLIEVTTNVTITVPEPPVDLIVSACEVDFAGPSPLARATIQNTGTAPVTFQTNQVLARASGFGTPQTVRAPGGGLYLAAGGTHQVVVGLGSLGPGEYAVTWSADPDDVVLESNGMNNGRWCPFSIAAPEPIESELLPDLTIQVMISDPNSGPPGTEFTFTVPVKNLGPGEHPGTVDQLLLCFVDGALLDADYEWDQGRMAPGETITHVVRTSHSFAPGTHQLECRVDAGNNREEANENNNSHTILFVITSDSRWNLRSMSNRIGQAPGA